MSEISLSINLVSHINDGLTTPKVEFDQPREIADEAYFYASSLLYFIKSAGKPALKEIDDDSYSIFLGNTIDIVEHFLTIMHSNISLIENRRVELEEIVSKLPKIK